MIKDKRMVLLHALTPLHVGTGQAVGNVDLPIAREKATGFPIVPASAFKGVLRDLFRTGDNEEDWVIRAFGDEKVAGAWVFTDLRLLCLPVRSFYGVFAYATCPLILRQLQQRAHAFGVAGFENLTLEVAGTTALAPSDTTLAHNGKLYLEDIDLNLQSSPEAEAITQTIGNALGLPALSRQFVILSDEVFNFFSETATEINARVRLDDTKTVADGGLWYEEAVPAEAIFYGFIATTGTEPALEALGDERLLQIGGDASIGRGVCRVVMRA